MRIRLVLSALIVALAIAPGISNASPDGNTTEAKMAAAANYFKQYPLNEMVAWMLSDVISQVPAEQQTQYREKLMKNIKWRDIESLATQSLAQRLSLEEIKALAEFVKRPEGKSALQKIKLHESDLMPFLNIELEKAIRALASGK